MTRFTFKHRGDWKAVVELLNDTSAYFTIPNDNEVIIYSRKWADTVENALINVGIAYTVEG